MSIGSIGGSLMNSALQATAATPKGGESREVGPDHDGDADDGGAKAAQASTGPSVNLSGQTVGQLFSAIA